MDAKYGAVFTTHDVKLIVAEAVERGWESERELDAFLETYQGKFPPDEPVFVLRGQDLLAGGALGTYRDDQPIGARQELIQDVIDQFETFKRENPERMKIPD